MLERIEHPNAIVEIRLNRPPANALNPALVTTLCETVRALPDEGAKAILFSGRPGMLSAGLDVPALLALDRQGIHTFFGDFFELMASFAGSPVPIAAAITGHAPAGGAVLAILSDFRVMAEGNYRMGLNEVAVGLKVPYGVRIAVERLVGHRAATRMCMEAQMLTSTEAQAMGLVDELLPAEAVTERALAWCEDIVAFPPVALLRERAHFRRPVIEAFKDRATVADEYTELWFSEETRHALDALRQRLASK